MNTRVINVFVVFYQVGEVRTNSKRAYASRILVGEYNNIKTFKKWDFSTSIFSQL